MRDLYLHIMTIMTFSVLLLSYTTIYAKAVATDEPGFSIHRRGTNDHHGATNQQATIRRTSSKISKVFLTPKQRRKEKEEEADKRKKQKAAILENGQKVLPKGVIDTVREKYQERSSQLREEAKKKEFAERFAKLDRKERRYIKIFPQWYRAKSRFSVDESVVAKRRDVSAQLRERMGSNRLRWREFARQHIGDIYQPPTVDKLKEMHQAEQYAERGSNQHDGALIANHFYGLNYPNHSDFVKDYHKAFPQPGRPLFRQRSSP